MLTFAKYVVGFRLIAKIKKSFAIDEQTPINYRKEFDNITCDSIYVAFEYRKEYENLLKRTEDLNEKGELTDDLKTIDNLKTFCFYEIMHYLESACTITRNLCLYSKTYINTDNRKVDGVELYRIHNMISLIEDTLKFMQEQSGTITIDSKDKDRLDENLEKIESILINDIIKVC